MPHKADENAKLIRALTLRVTELENNLLLSSPVKVDLNNTKLSSFDKQMYDLNRKDLFLL